MECIAEMREAIEHIDKLRKKQSSLVSSIKLATGASSGTDHIDARIFALKARMEKISLAMSECHQRWTEVESLCGFPLVPTSVTAEIVFPSAAASVLQRTGSSSSFYRKSDLVGGAVTASLASSSTSGNSPPVIFEVSSDVTGRVSPPVCSCPHESFTPAVARCLDSSNLQRHIHDNVNASRPLKFVAESNELLQRSSSSVSFNKLRCLGSFAKMQKSRNQSIGSLMSTITDDEFIPATSTVNKIIAPTTSSQTTTINRFLPFKQDLKLLKRNVSNAIFKSSSSTKGNGFSMIKKKNSTDVSTANNRKSKFVNLFHKTSKI
uniref:SOAR domain-containing protein n=1 Tax=Elaeophora elaphi TaxID=1147741 RepID=A0A0R3RQG8_9BILA